MKTMIIALILKEKYHEKTLSKHFHNISEIQQKKKICFSVLESRLSVYLPQNENGTPLRAADQI